jgi:hypothetical protein
MSILSVTLKNSFIQTVVLPFNVILPMQLTKCHQINPEKNYFLLLNGSKFVHEFTHNVGWGDFPLPVKTVEDCSYMIGHNS